MPLREDSSSGDSSRRAIVASGESDPGEPDARKGKPRDKRRVGVIARATCPVTLATRNEGAARLDRPRSSSCSPPTAAAAQAALSLDDVLREAHAANARLPVRAYELTIARERASEAQAERWLKVALEGDFVYAPANGYDPAFDESGRGAAPGRRAPADLRGRGVEGRRRARAGGRRGGGRALSHRGEGSGARGPEPFRGARGGAGPRSGCAGRAASASTRIAVSSAGRQASGQGVAADVRKTEVRIALEDAARRGRRAEGGGGASGPERAHGPRSRGARSRSRPPDAPDAPPVGERRGAGRARPRSPRPERRRARPRPRP